MNRGLPIRSLFALLACLTPASALAISEQDYLLHFEREVTPYLAAHGKFGTLAGKGGVPIATLSIETERVPKIGDILFVLGKSDSFLSSQELIYDLVQLGYSVHTYDHRSQGLSGRTSSNPRMVHVESFDDYVEDLHTFARSIFDSPLGHEGKRFLLSHSMGGAVSALYLGKYQPQFDQAVYLAPMGKPRSTRLANTLAKLACSFGLCESYVLGGEAQPTHQSAAEDGDTSSEPRQQARNRILNENSTLQSGSVSWGWLRQAFKAAQQIVRLAPENRIPSLIIQAGEDHRVDLSAQNHLAKLAPQCTLCKIPGSRHDIGLERDHYRNQMLAHIRRVFR